jgi:hypothetical protein
MIRWSHLPGRIALHEAAMVKLLCDVPTAGAILDRFLHHAQVIAITGKSYRVKEAPGVSPENKKSWKTNEPATAGAAS